MARDANEIAAVTDLSDPETRRALSPTALRGFFNIARKWRLDYNQMRGLLGGITRSTLHAWKRRPEKRVLGQDTITRISLVAAYTGHCTYTSGTPETTGSRIRTTAPCSKERFPLTT